MVKNQVIALKARKLISLTPTTIKKIYKLERLILTLNGHVNNAVYLEFALEGLDFNIRDLDQMQIIYKNEVKYGDDIKLHYKSDDQNYYFKLTSGTS